MPLFIILFFLRGEFRKALPHLPNCSILSIPEFLNKFLLYLNNIASSYHWVSDKFYWGKLNFLSFLIFFWSNYFVVNNIFFLPDKLSLYLLNTEIIELFPQLIVKLQNSNFLQFQSKCLYCKPFCHHLLFHKYI